MVPALADTKVGGSDRHNLLLRHGQSVLNAQDPFTGLLDPLLSSRRRRSGTRRGSAGLIIISPDTSPPTLTRIRDTARIVLDVTLARLARCRR
jgi:2,3-bisphosphoglycerate-dependent phosphoglycerate mutase